VPKPGIALAIIVTCQLMVVLDTTIVNVALPQIKDALHFTPTGLSWVLNAYTLTFGGLLLLGGRAGDILGRRRVFLFGVLLFSAASLLGGLAQNASGLIAARAAQGVGGAIASPTALALIATHFREGPDRTRAMSTWGAVAGAGGGLGLILGGVLTDWVSWQWVLYVNVPIGLAIAALTPRYLAESDRQPGRFDLFGALSSTIGMSALVYGFIRAATNGWGDRYGLIAFGIALVFLVAFVINETAAKQPIVPLRLFADRNRAIAFVTRLFLVAGMFGMFFFLTQFTQNVLDWSPLQAGLAVLPSTVLILCSAKLVTRLVPKYGVKSLTVIGVTITTLGMVWLSFISEGTNYWTGILGPMILFGIGMGVPFVTLTLLSLAAVPPQDSGAASGLVNVMQQLGGALGLSILVTVFGTASRHSAEHNPNAPKTILTDGIATTFTVATIFIATMIVLTLLGIKAGRPAAPTPAGRPSENGVAPGVPAPQRGERR
jgi:EmrB/QacA subfamily drug resistance transporter